MIKINLLPSQILEQAKVKAWLYGSAVAILIVAGALLVVMTSLTRQLEDEKARVAYWTSEAEKVNAVGAMTATVNNNAKPYMSWNGFFNAIGPHNSKYADLLLEIAKHIDARVQIRDLSVSGPQVSMSGSTKNLDIVVQAYMNLSRAPCFVPNSVTFSTQVPSWSGTMRPQTTSSGTPYSGSDSPLTLTGTLNAQWAAVFNPLAPPGIAAPAGGTPRGGPRRPGGGPTLSGRKKLL